MVNNLIIYRSYIMYIEDVVIDKLNVLIKIQNNEIWFKKIGDNGTEWIPISLMAMKNSQFSLITMIKLKLIQLDALDV